MGERLMHGLKDIHAKHAELLDLQGRGLVAALMALKDRSAKEPWPEFAFEVVKSCFERGLLMFAPVGRQGGTIKIAPPLCIDESGIDEGLEVLAEVIDEQVAAMS